MDGRDAMAISGSYYMQRGLSSSGNPGTHPGLHGGVPPGMRSMPNPGSGQGGGSLAMQSAGIGSSAFQVESSQPISAHGGGIGVGGSGGGGGGVIQQGEQVKRKRGRPRKYGPDGSVALALSPISSSGPSSAPGILTGSSSGLASGSGNQKRGRGRPPGSGRKQQLASLGELVAGSAGMGFTPHVITVDIGEDITTKIMSFSQQGPRAVCILSANGAVSTVTLRQPATSGGTVTYEGRFEILCLSGSYMVAENDGSRSRSGGLSISLSSPDGRVIGGGVGGLLRAATPVQVIVGSFIYAGSKAKNKAKISHDSGAELELQGADNQSMPPTSLPNQSLGGSPVMGGWPSRQLDMRNSHIDIDLTRG